jgi:cytochrome c-type biogenesis protein CcmH/NrfF
VSQRRQPATEPANLVSLFLLPILWLVLGPVLAWRVRKRTEGAIEALLASAAEVARAG